MRSVALLAVLALVSSAAMAQSLSQLTDDAPVMADPVQAAPGDDVPDLDAMVPEEPVETFAPLETVPSAEQCRVDGAIAAFREQGFQQLKQDLDFNDDPQAGDVIYFRKRSGERMPITGSIKFAARPEIWGKTQGATLRRIIVVQLNATLGLKDGTQSLFRRRVTENPVAAIAEVYVPYGGRMGGTDVYLLIAAPDGCAMTARLNLADGVHDPDREQALVDRLFRAVLRSVLGDQEKSVKGVMWRRLVGHGPKEGEGLPVIPALPGAQDEPVMDQAPQADAPQGPVVTEEEGGLPPVYVMPEEKRDGALDAESPYAPIPVPRDELDGPAPPVRQAPLPPVEDEPQFDDEPAVPALPDPGLPAPADPQDDAEVPVEDMIGLPMVPQAPEPATADDVAPAPAPEPDVQSTPLPHYDVTPKAQPDAAPVPKRTSTGLGAARRDPRLEVIGNDGAPKPALGGRRTGPRMEVLRDERPASGASLGERRAPATTRPQKGDPAPGTSYGFSAEDLLERGFDKD